MKLPVAARILIGLLAGLAAGYVSGPQAAMLPIAQAVGGIWLDGLRMSIIPLVFALIVVGIGTGLGAGGSTGVARRALVVFIVLLFVSAMFGVALGSALFNNWTVTGFDTLRTGGARIPDLPPLEQSLRALVPSNPIASAAQGAVVPVVVFALFFALALRRIDASRAALIGEFFKGVTDALLVIIGWVLWVAPLGVFALAFDVTARGGLAVGAVLAWYVAVRVIGAIILTLTFILAVAVLARTSLSAFVRAVLPAQSVALSTQSSLASLPAMLGATRTLALPDQAAGTVLPLAVALFRIGAPTAIAIATLALARMNGIELGLGQLALVALLATLNNLVIAGLPNQISFFAAYAPVALAVGIPIEMLALFLAIDTVPDMFSTVANVTADVAVTTIMTENLADPEEPIVA
jgi:Na+/H+-dicarboxylate symporter